MDMLMPCAAERTRRARRRDVAIAAAQTAEARLMAMAAAETSVSEEA
jgi:hypothetical protein